LLLFEIYFSIQHSAFSIAMRVLDVRAEELRAATDALQRLALALLEDVFECGPGLTHQRWFGSSDARVLDRTPLVRLGWRRFVARVAPALTDALTDRGRWATFRSGRPRWSAGAVRARLALDAHGVEGLLIPDRLLGLVGRAAWESAAFRVQASTLVLDHFRARLIAPAADQLPAPRVTPAVIWMILATARVAPPALVRVGLAHRAERRALARLQRFAHTVLDESALPVDFWSHWIAWHVERRYGQRSTLPPEWHSRLSAADRPAEASTRRRGDPADPSHAWTAPEALAAAYAAWYPAGAPRAHPAGAERGSWGPASDGDGGSGGAKPPGFTTDRRVARVRLDSRS
jgi:hypothetical protein